MADDNVLLRLDRLEARAAIENLMGWYQHYFSLRDTDSILEKLWAEDTCAITLEDRFYGVYEGREGAFPDGGMRTYYASVMGFGSPADRPGKLMSYAMTTQTLEIAADAQTAQGLWLAIGAEGDAGELVYDDVGRPDRRVSGVHLTSSTPDGKRYQADWVWQKMAVDFIRRPHGWKIWHLHIYDVFRCPYGEDWVHFSQRRSALNEAWGAERCFSPYGKPPGRGCSYHWEDRMDAQPPARPIPPRPYVSQEDMSPC